MKGDNPGFENPKMEALNVCSDLQIVFITTQLDKEGSALCIRLQQSNLCILLKAKVCPCFNSLRSVAVVF